MADDKRPPLRQRTTAPRMRRRRTRRCRRRSADRARVRSGLVDAARRSGRDPGGRNPHRRARARHLALGVGGVPQGRIVEIFGPSRRGRRRLVTTTSSPRPRRVGGSARSSTPSARSTRSTPAGSGSTPTSCWAHQPGWRQALEIVDVLVHSRCGRRGRGGLGRRADAARRGSRANGETQVGLGRD